MKNIFVLYIALRMKEVGISMKKLMLSLIGMVMLCGCASSQVSASVANTSTGNASVSSVNDDGAVLKISKDGKSRDISVRNQDHVVVIRERKTISPASLIPGEQVEITYHNGDVSTICVQGQ